MTPLAALVLPLLLALTAQDKKPANPNAIPANAVRIDDQTYKLKEKDGKTWVYRRTPFGVSRVEESQFNQQNDAKLLKPVREVPVKVVDLGEQYRFERSSAFGVQVWKTRKAELNDDEKSYVEKARAEGLLAAGEKKN